jgi:hypothetical protein
MQRQRHAEPLEQLGLVDAERRGALLHLRLDRLAVDLRLEAEKVHRVLDRDRDHEIEAALDVGQGERDQRRDVVIGVVLEGVADADSVEREEEVFRLHLDVLGEDIDEAAGGEGRGRVVGKRRRGGRRRGEQQGEAGAGEAGFNGAHGRKLQTVTVRHGLAGRRPVGRAARRPR